MKVIIITNLAALAETESPNWINAWNVSEIENNMIHYNHITVWWSHDCVVVKWSVWWSHECVVVKWTVWWSPDCVVVKWTVWWSHECVVVT